MIKKYSSFIFLMLGMFCNAQINFLNNPVIDQSYSIGAIHTVITFDAEGDGDLDVISASSSGIAWQENLDGLGNYGDIHVISNANNGVTSISAVDLDNDSDLDILATSNTDQKIAWYRNLGQGVFGPQITIGSSSYAKVIKAGDLDGDGDLDVVSVTAFGTLVWFKNTNGQGNFTTGGTIGTGLSTITSIDIADIDGDGDNDIISDSVLTDQYIKLFLFKNTNGLGAFGASQLLNNLVPQYGYSITSKVYFMDLDNDSDKDIYFFANSKLYAITNNSGTLAAPTLIYDAYVSYRFQDLNFVDMDQDGDLDITAAMRMWQDNDRIYWFQNDGSNSYSGPGSMMSSTNDQMVAMQIVDVDGDNEKDVIVANKSDNYLVWHKYFGAKKAICKFTYDAQSVRAVDLDGDGDLDLLSPISNAKLVWYENLDGAGNMGMQKVILLQGNLYSYDTGDINGDGKIDILIDGKWLKNSGNGTFTSNTVAETYPDNLSSVSLFDVDKDGKLDIVSLDNLSNGISVCGWYKNSGSGSFGARQVIFSSGNFSVDKIDMADVDGDNDNDFVISTSTRLELIRNNNNGTFAAFEDIDNHGTDDATFADMDNDGDKDIVVGNGYFNYTTSGVGWFKNNSGTFSNGILITAATNASGAYPIDIDNDGDMDILSRNGANQVWLESLNGIFNVNDWPKVLISYPNSNSSNFLGDIDNDGKKDFLFSTTSQPYTVSWFKNTGLSLNRISGTVKLDLNHNGCDTSDDPMPNVKIVTQTADENYATFTNSTGYYQIYLPTPDNYTTAVTTSFPSYFTITPASYANNFTGIGNIQTSNFCVADNQTVNDLEVVVYPTNDARPGFTASYVIVYKNKGTTQLSGNVKFQFNVGKLTYLSASQTPTSQATGELNFAFTNLKPFESRSIRVKFTVATIPTTSIGEHLSFTTTAHPVSEDATPDNNVYTFDQTVIGSFDPNDIAVLEGAKILISQIDDYLHYTIRFQNTGTANAINVTVTNKLDDRLDWDTLEIDGISHNNYIAIHNGNEISFVFNGINLPYSMLNEAASQGFICYRIKPKSNSTLGTIFRNNAQIYFDFNPAIHTNTVETQVMAPLNVTDTVKLELSLFPNPTNGKITLISNLEIRNITVFNIYGQKMFVVGQVNEVDLSDLSSGIYFVNVQDDLGRTITKKIIKR